MVLYIYFYSFGLVFTSCLHGLSEGGWRGAITSLALHCVFYLCHVDQHMFIWNNHFKYQFGRRGVLHHARQDVRDKTAGYDEVPEWSPEWSSYDESPGYDMTKTGIDCDIPEWSGSLQGTCPRSCTPTVIQHDPKQLEELLQPQF